MSEGGGDALSRGLAWERRLDQGALSEKRDVARVRDAVSSLPVFSRPNGGERASLRRPHRARQVGFIGAEAA